MGVAHRPERGRVRGDGAGAVGLVLFARMVPSALVAPFVAVSAIATAERILIVVHLVRALACFGAAVVLAVDASIAVVYVLLCSPPCRSPRTGRATWPLTPLLVRTPRTARCLVTAIDVRVGRSAALTFALAALLLALSGPAVARRVRGYLNSLAGVSQASGRRWPWRRRRSGSACSTSSGRSTVARREPTRSPCRWPLRVAGVRPRRAQRPARGGGHRRPRHGRVGWRNPHRRVRRGRDLGATAGVSLVGRGRLEPLPALARRLKIAARHARRARPWVAVCASHCGPCEHLLDVAVFTIMQENADERVIGRIFGLFELRRDRDGGHRLVARATRDRPARRTGCTGRGGRAPGRAAALGEPEPGPDRRRGRDPRAELDLLRHVHLAPLPLRGAAALGVAGRVPCPSVGHCYPAGGRGDGLST